MRVAERTQNAVEPLPVQAVDRRVVVDRLFSDSRDALLLLDADGRIAEVNQEWLVLCGFAAADLKGLRWSEVPLAGSCEIRDVVSRVLADGVARSATIYHEHRRGFFMKLEARVAPLREVGRSGGILARLRVSPT